MEISTITTERLGNDSLQFSSKANLMISPSSRGFKDMEQQNNTNTDLKSSQTSSSNSTATTTAANIVSSDSSGNDKNEKLNNNDSSNASQHEDDDVTLQRLEDVKQTLDSLLGRIDSELYPIVTATTSQSLIFDSCTKVPLISPVKDLDLNKTSDIVMLRNLEITPPPQLSHSTPSPNLTKDIDEAAASTTARKRRATKRTQSEQSDESSSTTTGRSKRQRKQTELFQAQLDKKTPTTSSSRKSTRTEPKPQSRHEESKFQDVIFYERGDHLAIRNEENTFYLCELTENVRVQRPFVKVRWLDTDDGGKTYFLTSHYDKVPQKSIIMPVTLDKMKADKKIRQKFTIDEQNRNTVLERLTRSLNIPAE